MPAPDAGDTLARFLARQRETGRLAVCQRCGRERPPIQELRERGVMVCERCAVRAALLEAKAEERRQALWRSALLEALEASRGGRWWRDRFGGLHREEE